MEAKIHDKYPTPQQNEHENFKCHEKHPTRQQNVNAYKKKPL